MINQLTNHFLERKEVKEIITILEKASLEPRFVGGCVRNLLMQREVIDIDLAIKAHPEEVIATLEKNEIQYDDFAKKYGSVIAYVNEQKFDITSLREDINQQGRHTNIRYTKDWKTDSQRRDFTMNSLYLSSDGTLHDYYNGQEHIADQKLQFIGDTEERVKEDYLRIFRYYRFLGCFKNPKINMEDEQILHNYCKRALQHLSNELVRKEILKMFDNPFPIHSFCNNNNKLEKNFWVVATKENFILQSYELGLTKCLNKVEELF